MRTLVHFSLEQFCVPHAPFPSHAAKIFTLMFGILVDNGQIDGAEHIGAESKGRGLVVKLWGRKQGKMATGGGGGGTQGNYCCIRCRVCLWSCVVGVVSVADMKDTPSGKGMGFAQGVIPHPLKSNNSP